ncbi:MAG TPA: hypothetical protein VHQ47_11410 [Phycisphaerae bacterium]|jgi:hypothetical protein|nr:hypothetical protein [Phycisphaerae bacterium]
MKCSLPVVAAALFAAVGITALPASADNLLDQGLGGSDTSTPAPAAKPDPGPPVAPALVDPDAAKVVDDMDLLKKLTAGSSAQQNDTGAEQQMKDMVDRMGESRQRLADKDPGAVTQETQRRIVVDLDALIEIARKQCNSTGQSQSQSKSQSQQRQATKNQSHEGGSTAARDENLRGGGAQGAESNGTDIHQKNADNWGNLPPRDRDMIAHGSNEQYLPEYRQLIDRYYQALAEIGRSTRDH